jgi:hypothetical protein
VELGGQGPEPVFVLAPILDAPRIQPQGELARIVRDNQNVHTQVVSRQTNTATEKLLRTIVPADQQTEKSIVRAWMTLSPAGWNRMLATLNDMNTWFNAKTCRAPDDQLYRHLLRGLVAMINRTDD